MQGNMASMIAPTHNIQPKTILIRTDTDEGSTDPYFLSEFNLYETNTVRLRAMNDPYIK